MKLTSILHGELPGSRTLEGAHLQAVDICEPDGFQTLRLDGAATNHSGYDS